ARVIDANRLVRYRLAAARHGRRQHNFPVRDAQIRPRPLDVSFPATFKRLDRWHKKTSHSRRNGRPRARRPPAGRLRNGPPRRWPRIPQQEKPLRREAAERFHTDTANRPPETDTLRYRPGPQRFPGGKRKPTSLRWH